VGGVYVSGNTVFASTNDGLSISPNGGRTFTDYSTATETGNYGVGGVYVSGNTVYACTYPSLSRATITYGTGVVTGAVVFTDTAGRTLAYSSSATSMGGGTVSINATSGAFTYTPTSAQRQTAISTTTDTFTITANNGVRTTAQTVTVAVDPGTH
jgi:VCBS repeat-containing protein